MTSRYTNIKTIKNEDGIRYKVNNFYPDVSPSNDDIYVITVETDRYDLLANQYYQDTSLWWIIPACNNLDCDSLYPPPGIQIRIPVNVEEILKLYNKANV